MTGKRCSARDRFKAVFEHDTSGIDRLPMLSLGTPPQGLFRQEWERTIGNEDLPEEFIRLTRLGDKTMEKWITSEWQNTGLGWPTGYPHVDLPASHPAWAGQEAKPGETLRMNIGWNGSISVSGKSMHGVSYGWYVNGHFTRQVTAAGDVLAPWEVRDAFYAEHGEPWDDKFAPGEAARKEFQDQWKWYEAHCNDFSDEGFWDFALMSSAGGLFEGTWEGMGSGTPGMSIMCRKYPGKLRTWLRQVTDMAIKSIKLQHELAGEVGATVDFTWLWDDSGQKGRSLIDPAYHREFWVPEYKRVCDVVHAHGGHVIIHSCGFGESLVENWVEAGIDAWQTIERAALNEPSRIREKIGNKLILVGAIDASNTVSFASEPGEIVDHVRQTFSDAVVSPDDPCYVPGFTHDLLDCPVANVRLAVDEMLARGRIDALREMKKKT